jgi:RNA recognition motif-containing protein
MQRHLDLDVPIETPRVDALRRPANGTAAVPTHRAPKASPDALTPADDTRPRRESRNGRSVYIANLPWTATSGEVESLFRPFGEVAQATIIMDRRTGRSKGFAFVDMPEGAARSAIEALHGTDFGGRDLTVRFAQSSKFESSSTPRPKHSRRKPARSGARNGRRR